MQSLHGIFENGKIKLLHPLPKNLPDSSNVLVTFVIDDGVSKNDKVQSAAKGKQEKSEEYYQSIREFERVEARGNITIIDQDDQFVFPLNDYSQGGLSFISDRLFGAGQLISSGITDPSNPELVLMELKMEVRGIFKNDDKSYKVGCMFLDPVDEDLWHGLLQYLS
ncbi:PilZ domain-containing protein [bacterium]|nr:PilZ domain-containing protein [bacterium]